MCSRGRFAALGRKEDDENCLTDSVSEGQIAMHLGNSVAPRVILCLLRNTRPTITDCGAENPPCPCFT